MWLTFFPSEPACSLDEGFGAISVLNEVQLSSEQGIPSNLEGAAELITYVHKGVLALAGPEDYSGVITAGEFQCMVIARILLQSVTNTSRTDPAHFFRISLRLPSSRPGGDYVDAQTRFTVAQRRNILCTVASPDARNHSLRIHADAHVYSSILDTGQHIVHELLHGRKAWLHLVHGEVSVNGHDLTLGDGMGITDEPSISLTVHEDAELLLIDTVSDSNRG